MWTVNESNYSLKNDRGVIVQLKPKQFELLLALGQQQVQTKEQLIKSLWGGNIQTGENRLQNTIWQLRQQFADIEPDIITTIPRQGYRLNISLAEKTRVQPVENKQEVLLRLLSENKLLIKAVLVSVVLVFWFLRANGHL